MSCGSGASCGSCGPGGSESLTEIEQVVQLEELIKNARRTWSIPLNTEADEAWDAVFNEIAMGVSRGNAQSLKPLLEVFNRKGVKPYLDVCLSLCSMNMLGPMVCWAHVYSAADCDTFVSNVLAKDRGLIDEVNRQAEFYECFPENPRVGRAFYPGESQPLRRRRRRATSQQAGDKPGPNWAASVFGRWPFLLSVAVVFVGMLVLHRRSWATAAAETNAAASSSSDTLAS